MELRCFSNFVCIIGIKRCKSSNELSLYIFLLQNSVLCVCVCVSFFLKRIRGILSRFIFKISNIKVGTSTKRLITIKNITNSCMGKDIDTHTKDHEIPSPRTSTAHLMVVEENMMDITCKMDNISNSQWINLHTLWK